MARLGVTQSELASRIGISTADMSRYRSRKQTPRIPIVEKIALALGRTLDEVLIQMGEIDKNSPALVKGASSKKIFNAKGSFK